MMYQYGRDDDKADALAKRVMNLWAEEVWQYTTSTDRRFRPGMLSVITSYSIHYTKLYEAQAGVPRFIGGLVGYLGYESVRFFEPVLKSRMTRSANLPDGMYLLADTVIAFDHARRSLSLIANVLDGDVESANRKLDEIESRIHQPLPPVAKRDVQTSKTRSNMTQGRFEDMVRDAKEFIAAGDIFQVVLSQRFTRETNVEPFDVYRAVRRLNPSPYIRITSYNVCYTKLLRFSAWACIISSITRSSSRLGMKRLKFVCGRTAGKWSSKWQIVDRAFIQKNSKEYSRNCIAVRMRVRSKAVDWDWLLPDVLYRYITGE